MGEARLETIKNQFRMTMSVRYLGDQLDKLRQLGYPKKRALNVLNLTKSDFNCPKRRICVNTIEAMYNDACEALDDPMVGLQLGFDSRVTTFGKTGAIYSHCKNLRQVFELNGRYQKISVDVGIGGYAEESGRHYFVFETYPEAQDMRQILGMIYGSYATAFRWLSWSAGRELKAVHLVRTEPDDPQLYFDAVNCPVFFNQPRNSVEFFPETMDADLPTHNPEKVAVMVSLLDRVIDKANCNVSFLSAVKESIRAALKNGKISKTILAEKLNMPDGRLKARLLEQGLKYKDILADERRALFKELQAEGRSLTEISHCLAYNDQAAFTRAFKRWYGVTPSAYNGEDVLTPETQDTT